MVGRPSCALRRPRGCVSEPFSKVDLTWRDQIQSFRDQIAMEGTDATGTLPKRQHSSATPSPRATYTPSSKTMVPSGNTMVSQLEFMSNWMDLGICLRWRGRVRLEPCQIGSARPRRQARGRRSLHPFKSIRFDMFHSLTNMWRFGFGVRENVGKKVRDHVRQRAVRILFSDIVNKAVWEPTPDCAQKYNVHVFSLS